MTLSAFFQLSASVFFIVATIFMVTLLIWSLIFRTQINRLIATLENILEIAKATAGETQDFIEQTIQELESFKNGLFTFGVIRKVVTGIIKVIKNNSKGAKNGQEN